MMNTATYCGVASLSSSIFCRSEPRNTKFILAEIIDFVVATIEGASETAVFVQVGANDGVRGDPLRQHVVTGRWRGLLIEPVPEAMERLQANYTGREGLVFRREAIWEEETTRDFHFVRGEDVLSSFSMETIMLHALKYDDLASMIETRPVVTRRLDSLCRETGFEKPDLLVVDVEGCDDIVLRSFDFARHRPAIVLFEHVALSEDASRSIAKFLDELGYELISDRHDCLCLLRDAFDPKLVRFLSHIITAARDN